MSGAAAARADDPPQLALPGLLALVDRFRKAPPDRALWRELLDLSLGDRETFVAPDGRKVAASAVHHCGLAVYVRANAAGVVEGFSLDRLARDCRLGERTTRTAFAVLRDVGVVRQRRASRRAASDWLMNIGGLPWATARRQVSDHFVKQDELALTASESGHGDRTESGHGDRTKGLRTRTVRTGLVIGGTSRRSTYAEAVDLSDPLGADLAAGINWGRDS